VSKLQEVGRGLRLPVDEKGSRVSGDEALEFYLTYLVDFTEKDFANRLVDEINSGVSVLTNVKDHIKEVAEKRDISEGELLGALFSGGFINPDFDIVKEKYEDFIKAFPEFDLGLHRDRIIDGGDGDDDDQEEEVLRRIHINKNAYKRLADLWESINVKHIITLE